MKTIKIASVLFFLTVSLFPQRIISLAPAVTEIVFQLGKGHLIVGNTKFCDYPEAARKITKVGGLLDLNLEMVIDLQPDLIILYPEQIEKVKILEDKTRLLVVKHRNLDDLFESIRIISQELKVPRQGSGMIADIKHTFDRIRAEVPQKKKIKTLLVAGRNPDRLSNIYIVGSNDFLNEVLDVAGGVNAYNGNLAYPNISIESIVAMNPDVIIELSAYNQNIKNQDILNIWQKFPIISAVRNNRIHIIRDPVWLRPGPRVGRIAQKMYDIFFRKNPPPQ
jgi:iron complex transport system substrate-binding protein